MEPPSALTLECPQCGQTPHRVLKGRLSRGQEMVLEGTVRCLRCGFTRQETYREWTPRPVPIVVSDRGTSHTTEVELFPDEVVRVGDALELEEGRVEITAIEVGERRVEEANADQVDTLWSRRADRSVVKVSLNKGSRTLSYELEAAPEEEFGVGDVVELGRDRGVVHRIKTERGLRREGRVPARDIVRVYCTSVRGPRGPGGGR